MHSSVSQSWRKKKKKEKNCFISLSTWKKPHQTPGKHWKQGLLSTCQPCPSEWPMRSLINLWCLLLLSSNPSAQPLTWLPSLWAPEAQFSLIPIILYSPWVPPSTVILNCSLLHLNEPWFLLGQFNWLQQFVQKRLLIYNSSTKHILVDLYFALWKNKKQNKKKTPTTQAEGFILLKAHWGLKLLSLGRQTWSG